MSDYGACSERSLPIGARARWARQGAPVLVRLFVLAVGGGVTRLCRTLKQWKDAFLAYFDTSRASNGGPRRSRLSGKRWVVIWPDTPGRPSSSAADSPSTHRRYEEPLIHPRALLVCSHVLRLPRGT